MLKVGFTQGEFLDYINESFLEVEAFLNKKFYINLQSDHSKNFLAYEDIVRFGDNLSEQFMRILKQYNFECSIFHSRVSENCNIFTLTLTARQYEDNKKLMPLREKKPLKLLEEKSEDNSLQLKKEVTNSKEQQFYPNQSFLSPPDSNINSFRKNTGKDEECMETTDLTPRT